MKRLFVGAFLSVILMLVGGFAFWQWNVVDATWRYKITVNIETPEGIKSGSSVRQISSSAWKIKVIDLPEATNLRQRVSGEAVVVDLGDRGTLFALIDWDSYYEFIKVFPYTARKGAADSIKYHSNLAIGLEGELTDKAHWPLMVTFKNMHDAKSVVAVYEVERCTSYKNNPVCNGMRTGTFEKVNRLEEFFGEGVKIQNITVEVTDESKTRAIAKIFPDYTNMPSIFGGARLTRGVIK